jgi:hypothetical protein
MRLSDTWTVEGINNAGQITGEAREIPGYPAAYIAATTPNSMGITF